LARVTSGKIKEIQEKVSFKLSKPPKKLTWEEAEELVNAFKNINFIAPSTEGLCIIGEERIRSSILNILDPEFEAVVTRAPSIHSGGTPFQVEVAIAYGGHAGRSVQNERKAEIMRFANRAPLLFDAGGCAITKAVNSVDWKRYGIKDFANSPVTLFVSVVSTYIPYTSAGKQSIADEKEIVDEIKKALMELGRKFQRYHEHKHRQIERQNRLNMLLNYSTELADALSKLSEVDKEEILKHLTQLIKQKVGLDVEEG